MQSIIEKLVLKIVTDYLSKFMTPEVVRHWEDQAVQFAVCKLATAAKSTQQTNLDDAVVATVAAALGVDLSKCPA